MYMLTHNNIDVITLLCYGCMLSNSILILFIENTFFLKKEYIIFMNFNISWIAILQIIM